MIFFTLYSIVLLTKKILVLKSKDILSTSFSKEI